MLSNLTVDTQENLDDCVEEDDFEIIAEGLASSVSKTWASVDNGEPQLLAIKTSTTIKKWAKEPHDIIKECRLLRDLSHPNVQCISCWLNGETNLFHRRLSRSLTF